MFFMAGVFIHVTFTNCMQKNSYQRIESVYWSVEFQEKKESSNKKRSAIFSVNGAQKILIDHTQNHFRKETRY